MFKNTITIAGLSLLALSCSSPQSKEPMVIGMGLPLTGIWSDYGQMAKRGYDLALEEINAAGGVHGRPLEVDFQDTQGDHKQAVAVAQKFIADPRILLTSESGTATSMAVAPLYQKAKLVMCGFHTPHPDFTKPGDYIWSNHTLLNNYAIDQALYAKDLGLKKIAYFCINTEYSKIYGDFLLQTLKKEGVEVLLNEAYLPTEKDFRPLISKAKQKNVDGFVVVSFLADVSLLVQQIREQGLHQPIVAGAAVAYNAFPRLAGKAAEGVYVHGLFYSHDPRPEVVNFMKKWQAKYPQIEPDHQSVQAYDSMILVSKVLELSDGTRPSVKEAMAKVKDVPSILCGKVNFNLATRRVDSYREVRLIVKEGKLVRWEGTQ